MAKTIKDFAEEQVQMKDIQYLVEQIESTCLQAFDELRDELELIKVKAFNN